MMELIQARQLAWELVAPTGVEWVSLPEALGRILAEPLVAGENIPAEARSRMDGFAFRSADSAGAGSKKPIRLQIARGVAKAGHPTTIPVAPGESLQILTGAPLPPNADTVAPNEDVTRQEGHLIVTQPLPPGRHVTSPGDDIRAGERLFSAGALLTATRLALAAALGCAWLPVYRRPGVALLATGDEVIELGERPRGPSTTCNNRHLLAALVRLQGGHPIHLGIARDDPSAILDRLAAARADLVITTGGVGHGDRDFVSRVWRTLGIESCFDEINLSPGKNSALGIRGETIFVGLPGAPWSAQVVFTEIVAPMLRRWQGLRLEEPACWPAVLGESLKKRSGYYQAIRGELALREGKFSFAPKPSETGSLFARMRNHSAYAVLAPDAREAAAGTWVETRCPDLPLLALPFFTPEERFGAPPGGLPPQSIC
jgi:molybdopterin molybdotransferase